jgi:hypothetical protein
MTTTTQTPVTLNAADRCDRCGAQAYVRVTLPTGGTLLFCGHHFHDHEPTLRQKGVDILDETERLTEVPTFDHSDLDEDVR